MNNKIIIYKKLDSLSKSTFRSKFKLKDNDIYYIRNKGINTIIEHAYDIVINRLSSSIIDNDGKQTPMRGHPVFIAQHATATCCRSCLHKWHNIDKNKELNENEINYIVFIIIEWIKMEILKNI